MQETVTNTTERRCLFSSFLEVMEAREQQALTERQHQQDKCLHRVHRIFEFHVPDETIRRNKFNFVKGYLLTKVRLEYRQRREVSELRRLLEYVTQHTHVLETVLRGGGGAGGGEVPLSGALVRQAGAVQRAMAESVGNAARIRHLLAAAQRPQMDSLLARMEAELRTWSAFVQRSAEAASNTEVVIDNLRNLCEEQRRAVRELSSSTVLAEPAPAAPSAGSPVGSSTPIARA